MLFKKRGLYLKRHPLELEDILIGIMRFLLMKLKYNEKINY